MPRVILHIDMNKYYASVEQMLNPRLRGKAVAVCGSQDDRHGIVLTASAEAKAVGVQTGMTTIEAKRQCPYLITVPPQYDQYLKYSRMARAIYHEYTECVEPFGMDECWIDISAICSDFDDAEKVANEIRLRVRNELGLTVSIGVSFNKIFAKLGSDMKKPDAVTVLDPDHWKERVWPLPVSDLLYVGRQTTKRFARQSIRTIGDLALADPQRMRSILGKRGFELWMFANGLDTSRVMPADYESDVQSVGHGTTCTRDLQNETEVWCVIYELCQDIGHRLRKHGLSAMGVALYIRLSDLSCMPCRHVRLRFSTQSPLIIAKAAMELFRTNYAWIQNVRAITVTAIDLIDATLPVQTDMFGDYRYRERKEKLDDTVEALRSRFGYGAIGPCKLMRNIPIPDDGRHKVKMPGLMYR